MGNYSDNYECFFPITHLELLELGCDATDDGGLMEHSAQLLDGGDVVCCSWPFLFGCDKARERERCL